MDTESRRRLLREYVWFATILMAVLIGSAAHENAGESVRNQSQPAFTVRSEADYN